MSTPLLIPRNGVPLVVIDESNFEKLIDQLAKGSGPLAIDAERASGYRYSQRAYLIQIYRKDGGLHLIDPIALKSSKLWDKFNEQFSKYEWVIHASTQDLPCLIEVGLKPELLFDTELGARLAGCERVGLGPLSESLLELQLSKEHSAVDWSTRPLRPEWITYAALDVDILLDIRDAVEKLLVAQSKLSWAQADFAAILNSYQDFNFSDLPKPDRWRRTSGMHKVRDRLTMTIVRDLWLSRDELARELDLAPGRVLGDEAIVDLAVKRPNNLEAVAKLIGRRSRLDPPPFNRWLTALNLALQTPIADQPEYRVRSQNLPPIKIWKEKNPLGYARLTHARAALLELSFQLKVPTENLVTPELVRKICWPQPPALSSEHQSFVKNELVQMGARAWQIEQVTSGIAAALSEIEPVVIAEPVEVAEPEAVEGE